MNLKLWLAELLISNNDAGFVISGQNFTLKEIKQIEKEWIKDGLIR